VNLLEQQLNTVYFKDVRFPWVTLYNARYVGEERMSSCKATVSVLRF